MSTRPPSGSMFCGLQWLKCPVRVCCKGLQQEKREQQSLPALVVLQESKNHWPAMTSQLNRHSGERGKIHCLKSPMQCGKPQIAEPRCKGALKCTLPGILQSFRLKWTGSFTSFSAKLTAGQSLKSSHHSCDECWRAAYGTIPRLAPHTSLTWLLTTHDGHYQIKSSTAGVPQNNAKTRTCELSCHYRSPKHRSTVVCLVAWALPGQSAESSGPRVSKCGRSGYMRPG